jgi:hypothetical protein
MPAEATPHSYVLVSYTQWYKRDWSANLLGESDTEITQGNRSSKILNFC